MAADPGGCSTGTFRFIYPWVAVESDNPLGSLPVDYSVCRHPLAIEATVPKRLRAIAWMVREMAGGDPATKDAGRR